MSDFGLIGVSKEIQAVRSIIAQVAPSDISVLIHGESGSGKEVVARAIHHQSFRRNHQIVSINCAAIPEGIFESELFGHKKGSFTNASENRKGYFEMANGGTLFLDEIADMPLLMQVKLLRAIETREFMPVGADTVSKTDIRIIAATNKNLENEVANKRFREDFYYRLKSVIIDLPPLRKRKDDIPLLIKHFLDEYEESNKVNGYRFTDRVMEIFMEYNWPGNVRELRSVVRTAVAMSRSSLISEEVLAGLIKLEKKQDSRFLPVSTGKTSEEMERDFLLRALFEIKRDILEIQRLLEEMRNQKHEAVQQSRNGGGVITIQEAERDAIVTALRTSGGNKRKAAKLLNISPRTLYRKIEEYHIDEELWTA
ncbi:MAG: sigma-54-dependent Fis family transcriptional regulator [Ignavibacteriaceae bacterium]|nr:sigma-54-dependent Fis family transcriptional regulator [Ignavibacteriaceae bacterium]